jgi:hypothetical protein
MNHQNLPGLHFSIKWEAITSETTVKYPHANGDLPDAADQKD